MTYYSIADNQLDGKIMGTGRNSETLDEMFWSKMFYHSIDEETNEKTGKRIPWHTMYRHRTIRGKIEGIMDFDFTIVKHEKEYPDYDSESFNGWDELPILDDLSFDKAVKEFDKRYKKK